MITWVIDEHIQKHNHEDLYSIVRRHGYNAIVKSYRPFADDNKVNEIKDDDCAIVYGTVNFVRANRHIFGNYFNSNEYNMTSYRSKYHDCKWINDGVFTTWIELIKNYSKYCDIFKTDKLFVRPNSGEKTFTGLVLTRDTLNHQVNGTQQLTGVMNDTIVFVSKAKTINEEYRFFIVNQQPVAWSTYMVNHEHHERSTVPAFAMEFARDFAKHNTDPPIVLDVGRVGDEFGAIEINCVNSSGFYRCDVNNIVKYVSFYVSEQWGDTFNPGFNM